MFRNGLNQGPVTLMAAVVVGKGRVQRTEQEAPEQNRSQRQPDSPRRLAQGFCPVWLGVRLNQAHPLRPAASG